MAPSNQNLMIGPAAVYVSPWVTGGGAGTFVEMGHTKEPTAIGAAFENLKFESEQSLGTIHSEPVKDEYTVKFSPLEMTLVNLKLMLQQPAAAIVGTTLKVGDRDSTIFYQVKLVQTKHLPSPYVSLTVLLWRCIISASGDIQLAKRDLTSLSPTLDVLRDDTLAAGYYYWWQYA